MGRKRARSSTLGILFIRHLQLPLRLMPFYRNTSNFYFGYRRAAQYDWYKMYCNRKFHSNYHNHVPRGNFFCRLLLVLLLLVLLASSLPEQNIEIAKLYFPSRGIRTI